MYYYAASKVTYCERSDMACVQCRASWERAFPDGRFGSRAARETSDPSTASLSCAGANGCICLAYCELPAYRAELDDPSPPPATGTFSPTLRLSPLVLNRTTTDAGSSSSEATRVMWVEFLLGLVAVVLVLIPLAMVGRQCIRNSKNGVSP